MQASTRARLGAIAWLLQIQYFAVQLFVALSWKLPAYYSLRTNTISDLGNTACGPYGQQLVCSPFHGFMNLSFIMLGLMIIAGAVAFSLSEPSELAQMGYACMIMAGIGTILVGYFPEDYSPQMHLIGATLPFVLGNIGMITIGHAARSLPARLRRMGIISGIIGLVGLALYTAHFYLGLGNGGMERIVAYPQTIWMITVGFVLLHGRLRHT